MLQTAQTDYTSVLSELIQRQIVIFGPQIVNAKINGIKGLTYDKDGVVKKIVGDPQTILQEVAEQLSQLSEYAVKKTLDDIVSTHLASQVNISPDTSQLNNSQEDIISRLHLNKSSQTSA